MMKNNMNLIIFLQCQQDNQIAMDVQATIAWLLIRIQRKKKRRKGDMELDGWMGCVRNVLSVILIVPCFIFCH